MPATLLDHALLGLDFAGSALFAATGALAAARRKHDIVTFLFFGAVTGVGGGTLRDLLIGAPVFWVADARYLLVCALTAAATWAFAARLLRSRALLWLDALGLAAYAVLGAAKALAAGADPAVCVVMGVLTATFGGVVRDVLAGEPSVLLRREIYISAAILGACVHVGGVAAGAPPLWAAVAGVVCGFGLRAGALTFGWALPSFRGAPEDV